MPRRSVICALVKINANIVLEKYHIYMADTSRISLAGLNEHNVEYVAKSMDEVVRTVT